MDLVATTSMKQFMMVKRKSGGAIVCHTCDEFVDMWTYVSADGGEWMDNTVNLCFDCTQGHPISGDICHVIITATSEYIVYDLATLRYVFSGDGIQPTIGTQKI